MSAPPLGMNFSLLLALPPLPRALLLHRAGWYGMAQRSPAEAAQRLELDGEEARQHTLEGFALLQQAPLRTPIHIDSLYGRLLRCVYGDYARLPELTGSDRKALIGLGDINRMILLLRSGLGGLGAHSQAETALLIGRSETMVYKAVDRGLQALEDKEDIWARLTQRIHPPDPARLAEAQKAWG